MPLIGGGAVAELAISEGAAGSAPAGASSGTLGALVAVEIECYDAAADQVKTLRLCNRGPLLGTVQGARVAYEPALYVPLRLGAGIEADQYGEPMRAVASRGTIEFQVGAATRAYLDYAVIGRQFRVYAGDIPRLVTAADEIVDFGDPYAGLSLVYIGRIDSLSYDPVTGRATLGAADARIDLDAPLIEDLYGPSAPAALRDRPRPELMGTGYSLEPALEDAAAYVYRVSRTDLASVIAVRVGGVPWEETSGTPSPGQWRRAGGTVVFGGTILDGEVRVDARSAGWETYTTAALVATIVSESGSPIDPASIAALDSAAPQLVGYYASDPINRQDALDDIMTAIGGWWGATPEGRITVGLIAAPAVSATAVYTAAEIASLQLVKMLPGAWRVRVEYRRNWQPAGQFYSSVDEGERAAMKTGGIVTASAGDITLRFREPRAVDVPLIRSLVTTEADAIAIRDRLAAAWSVARRVWKAEIRADEMPGLMDTVGIDYDGVSGNFRVVSVVRSFGGGSHELYLWG